MEPKISVIVPVYNTELYLRQCLDSISTQTLKDIEIICVDDGSTDNSLKILKEYSLKDSRIIILQQENKGGGAARNLGMSVAKGKYLSFLDSDDFFDPNMLKLAYECSETSKSDVTIFMYKLYNNATKRYSNCEHSIKSYCLPSAGSMSHANLLPHIFDITNPSPWNKLFRHEFVHKHNLKFMDCKTCNDVYFVLSSLYLAENIYFLDQCLCYYRIGTQQNTQSQTFKSPYDIYNALLNVKKRISNTESWSVAEKSFINIALEHCLIQLDRLKVKYPNQYIEFLSFLVRNGFYNLGITKLQRSDFKSRYFYGRYLCCLDTNKYGNYSNQMQLCAYQIIDAFRFCCLMVKRQGILFTAWYLSMRVVDNLRGISIK